MSSTYILHGIEEEGGIPAGASVRVEALPKRNLVWQGEAIMDDEVPLAIAPGKYVYVVSKMRESNAPTGSQATDLQYIGEFYHDISEKDFDSLQRVTVQAARFRNTSEGGMWYCQMGYNCRFRSQNEVAMVLHECEVHLGISKDELLASKKAQIAYKLKAEKAMAQKKAEEEKVKGRVLPAKPAAAR